MTTAEVEAVRRDQVDPRPGLDARLAAAQETGVHHGYAQVRIDALSDDLDEARPSRRSRFIEHLELDKLVSPELGDGRRVAIAIEERVEPLSHRPGVRVRPAEALVVRDSGPGRLQRRLRPGGRLARRA
jgi:hypothetical protein